ncbi:HIT domain protein [Candidatus Burarchaeum australiense]|nr:HIT domain protein [Candidatus Burarchaeum australiense]
MSDCIFCKIVSGEIGASKVYEDKYTLAFLDINPVNKGHVLVIPKKHFDTVLDMPEDEGVALAKASVKVGKAVRKATNCEGINLLHNIGKAAGQLVFHAHVHLIPRFSHDSMRLGWDRKQYANSAEQEEFRKKVSEAVGK